MEFDIYKAGLLFISVMSVTAIPYLKSISSKIDKNNEKADAAKEDMMEFKLHVSENYVTKVEMKDQLSRIEKGIDELKDMLTKQG